MIPDFSTKTKDIIAKRASYLCSNPECRIKTVGPNHEEKKTTLIGEAAHICGARKGSKRHDNQMTDYSRAEITNAIWLCRNCHKLIDSNEQYYTSNILFRWREIHEEYILSELNSKTSKIKYEELKKKLVQFEGYPYIIKRIVKDKPKAWEYRLTAELMKHLNTPLFLRIKDLQNGLYLKPQTQINKDEAFNWGQSKINEMQNAILPLSGLTKELNLSWGKPGEEGDLNKIHHVCKLFRDYIEQIIFFEENIFFTVVPESCEKLKKLLQDSIGSQVLKLETIQYELDKTIQLINERSNQDNLEPLVIEHEILIALPNNWSQEIIREMRKVNKNITDHNNSDLILTDNLHLESKNNGCLNYTFYFLIFIVVVVILSLI